MPNPNEAVNNQASATGENGANPEAKSFEEQALEILGGLEPKQEEKKSEHEEEKKETSEKEEAPEEKKEAPEKEDHKVPYERLQKEISKRKGLETKLKSYEDKYSEEQKRLAELSEDEIEERNNFKKLGLDTKADKLQEQIDNLKEALEESDEKIKSFEETESQGKIAKLSSRIEELTKKHDGSDGLPKFDIDDLVKFGKEENYMPEDPLKLYNFKYQNEIIAKKYQTKASEPDKGNKESFAPVTKKMSFKDPDFDKEALNIINSITT